MGSIRHRKMAWEHGRFGPAGRPLLWGQRVTVHAWERALLFRRGRLDTVLEPGAHRRWAGGFTVRRVDMRPWVLLVPAQEVSTADGAPVKVTVAGRVRVTDPLAYVTASQDVDEEVYLAVQLSLRALLSATTVDDLLTGRGELGGQLLAELRDLSDLGVAIEVLDVKDVVLPRELKGAQSEVLVARAQAAAALERARGESAALRNLANAARTMADNPALLQLRLLQQLDASSGHTVVLGGGAVGGAAFAAGASTTAASTTGSTTAGSTPPDVEED